MHKVFVGGICKKKKKKKKKKKGYLDNEKFIHIMEVQDKLNDEDVELVAVVARNS
jgi:hypothetical protein